MTIVELREKRAKLWATMEGDRLQYEVQHRQKRRTT